MRVIFESTSGGVAAAYDLDATTIRAAIDEAYGRLVMGGGHELNADDAVFATVSGNNGSVVFTRNHKDEWVYMSPYMGWA